ncbi:tRNA (adenosine(37)-N6)-threonylcarbamoyltransferase complex dimerization subunit type 1 TsaB [Dehalobacter sp. DCM]|uniref:tRNA (adenosine(37)-N6)-threonylcarbamoyltransferase complex dimerization subunit type 1 TsaB n=1 Tax=Dehalobacter sp. DCM TaxID=2907827 RepID=UPI0030816E92|nr:tRNA (adenosine(37)-N6)-threonylcarbamoyltransferase complex dimerization subunit type 1 TsaB [Dehalobacter sp. DCM]
MKYLTIDTTTKITALALGEDGKLICEGFLHTGKTHSERLIPMVDQLFQASGWKLNEVDLIGVVRGPGSFTGIRIGIATAQGLAQVMNIPIVGVSSLDALSWAGNGRPEDTIVILDARKNEWYYARYQWQDDQRECIEGPKAIAPDALLEELIHDGNCFFFAGDAVTVAKPFLQQGLGSKAVILSEYHYLPRGAYAASETWKVWNTNRPLDGFCTVEPVYIRASEAEVNYLKKQRASM